MPCSKLILIRLLILLAGILPVIGPRQARAQYPDPLLPETVNKMSYKGKTTYQEAMKELDHIRYSRALDKLAACALEIEKNSIPLQFYNARMHQVEALRKSGDEAKGYYERALKSVDLALNNASATQQDRSLATSLKDSITKDRDGLEARDQRRAAVCKDIQAELASELATPMTVKLPEGAQAGGPAAGAQPNAMGAGNVAGDRNLGEGGHNSGGGASGTHRSSGGGGGGSRRAGR